MGDGRIRMDIYNIRGQCIASLETLVSCAAFQTRRQRHCFTLEIDTRISTQADSAETNPTMLIFRKNTSCVPKEG